MEIAPVQPDDSGRRAQLYFDGSGTVPALLLADDVPPAVGGAGLLPRALAPVDVDEAQLVQQVMAELFEGGVAEPAEREGPWHNIDLGSAGPVLLPKANIVAGAGKDGRLFVIDKKTMGLRQVFQATKTHDDLNVHGMGFHHVHGSPVVWRNSEGKLFLYLWPERDFLYAYAFDDMGGIFVQQPVSTSLVKTPESGFPYFTSMPGGMLSLSANGGETGSAVLWASHPTQDDAITEVVGGIVEAFDAIDLTKRLWRSDWVPARDSVGLFAKYAPPTVANGRLYVPTFSNAVQLYGLVRWSKFVAQSAPPPEMVPGQPFGAHVTFKNQGVTTWRTGDGYHLGSDSPKKNTNWLAAPAVALTADVPPGEFVTFNFMAHAPNSEGT